MRKCCQKGTTPPTDRGPGLDTIPSCGSRTSHFLLVIEGQERARSLLSREQLGYARAYQYSRVMCHLNLSIDANTLLMMGESKGANRRRFTDQINNLKSVGEEELS